MPKSEKKLWNPDMLHLGDGNSFLGLAGNNPKRTFQIRANLYCAYGYEDSCRKNCNKAIDLKVGNDLQKYILMGLENPESDFWSECYSGNRDPEDIRDEVKAAMQVYARRDKNKFVKRHEISSKFKMSNVDKMISDAFEDSYVDIMEG